MRFDCSRKGRDWIAGVGTLQEAAGKTGLVVACMLMKMGLRVGGWWHTSLGDESQRRIKAFSLSRETLEQTLRSKLH